MNDQDDSQMDLTLENDVSKGMRSILKMSFSQPTLPASTSTRTHDQTEPILQSFSQPELLSHSNNTTSKLSVTRPQSGKINRRVSFAPDVTLHRFESVPQRALNKNDPLTNDTSIMDFTQPTPIYEFNKDTKSSNDMDESLDMTEIQIKNNTNNEDEESVELTERQEQLTPIMIAVDSAKSYIPQMDLRKGNILPNNESEDDNANDEEPMELTEVVNFNDNVDLSQIDKSTTNEESITGYKSIQGSKLMDFTQISSESLNKITDSQSMDFTQIYNPQNSKKTDNVESQPMELTQVIHSSSKQNETKTSKKYPLSTLPKLLATSGDDSKSSKDIAPQPNHTGTSLNSTLSSDTDSNRNIVKEKDTAQSNLESKIPPPSSIPRIIRKRKNLEDPITPVVNIQEELTNKKPNTANTESNIEEMEKMSPIKITQLNESDKENLNQKSDYSLKTFIKDTDVGFLTDINILKQDVKAIPFPIITQTEDSVFKAQSLCNALYNDIPMVQMNTFIIKELLSIGSQSSISFENLDQQIKNSSNPPLLLQDYFNSDDRTKETMKEQLQLIKYFAKLNAKKSFSEWYLSQLKNLKNVLLENETLLEQEYQKIRSTLEDIKLIHSNVGNIKNLLKAELQAIKTSSTKEQGDDFNLSQKIHLTWLKQELQRNKLSIEQYPKLCDQEEKLASAIVVNQTKLRNLKDDIMSKVDHGIDNIEIIPQLNGSQNMLHILESLTGIDVLEFKNSILSLKLQDISNSIIHVNLDLEDENIITVDSELKSNKLLPFIIDLLSTEGKATNNVKTLDNICHLINNIRNMTKVFKEFEFLDTLFLTKITNDSAIQFFDYNTSLNEEIIFEIDISAFVQVVMTNNNKVTLTAQTVNGETLETSDIMSRLTSKTQKILPWFNEDRIKIILK